MNVKAEEVIPNHMVVFYEPCCEEEVSLLASGVLCHCGGTRLEQRYSRYEHLYCDEHGSDCDYQVLYMRTYYYCSNPNCTDDYYSDWEYVTEFHQ